MSEALLFAGMAVIIVGGTVFGAWFDGPRGRASRRKARRSAMMQVPETPIAAVKDGAVVRIRGRAVASGPLRTSPFSQRRCIGFRVVIQYAYNGARIFEQEEFDSFVLTDGTSEAVVHAPFKYLLDPYNAREFTVNDAPSDLPPGLFDFVKQSGYKITTFGTDDTLRYVEILLRPDDEIIAVGRATVEVDEAGRAPSPRGLPVRCHLRYDDEPLVISDTEVT